MQTLTLTSPGRLHHRQDPNAALPRHPHPLGDLPSHEPPSKPTGVREEEGKRPEP